ncbi:lambda phage CII family protein [Erwinia tracheiphila]|uniref:Regulatory protein n=1 Tax=Erwinia tracheiphila TaxID=65700 RepID=A0A345CQ24_9GAMM|nr:CII family transcriptional regulator [Erwinia tracheiphila]AXF75541.1 hypothetical protein AV903_04545 [Erwinia tracheiphila]UIA81911.1 lambda phage CII family protein [Erwinia tracheiphila]UIA90506.1 lambda phage CII family protein [Erwinia tracheiphila]
MEIAKYRKKASRIESQLLGKLAVMGQTRFAKLMGLTDTKVSRMKDGFFQQAAMAIAILEYGVDDTEVFEIAKRILAAIPQIQKQKAPAARTAEASQISMSF